MTTLDKTWGGHPTPSQAAALLRKYARDKRLPPNDNNFDDAAAIIDRLAALHIPEQGVKALEWYESGGEPTAHSMLGEYKVYYMPGKGWFAIVPGEVRGKPVGGSEAEAKAAAQADYDQRIRSALTSHPAAVAVTDEMVERACRHTEQGLGHLPRKGRELPSLG